MADTTTTQLRIQDVMTKHPVAVMPSMSLTELARTLDANEISGVPVVDAQDRVIGVVSKTDLVHYHLEQLENPADEPFAADVGERMGMDEEEFAPASESIMSEKEGTGIVEHIMAAEPVTASSDEPLAAVAQRMAEEHVHRVIVTDEGGHLVGIVTSLDLLRHFPPT